MRPAFYDSDAYKKKQAEITARKHAEGAYKHLNKTAIRTCAREGCGVTFSAKRHETKRYCSRSCSAKVSNRKRIRTQETRGKISRGVKKAYKHADFSWNKGKILVPRIEMRCAHPDCGKLFPMQRWQHKQFCGIRCASRALGSRPTSPKAARGKSGIRPDISDSVCFYSRWEANFARICNTRGLRWTHTPVSFDIGGQHYTPDFYLPDRGVYIEVKNYWNEYSRIRDEKFRARYPEIPLLVITKEFYEALEETYADLIPNWEFKNSPAPTAI